jgi:hypothetical protein
MKIVSGLFNGQVLQRIDGSGASARLRGVCRMDGPVFVTIVSGTRALKGWSRRLVGQASRGKFDTKLIGIPAGGPYALTLKCGNETAHVASFFVGDVWILAGQSNMEGVGEMSGKATPHPLVRALSMRRAWRLATDPLHVVKESPDWCHHESKQLTRAEGEKIRRAAVKGTGVGIFFGQEMLVRSGVPQGLICTAHGGTSMQQWSPERKKLGGESLYASMLESVRATGQPVAGVLWYQGESDANSKDAPHYIARMKELVAASRRDLRQADLPWIIVQIARVLGQGSAFSEWNEIQEYERLLPRKIKRLETVAAIDLPLDDLIHIGADGYVVLARRLARMADRLVYGNRHEPPPPQPRRVARIGRPLDNVIEVTFDHIVDGLHASGLPHGFIFVTPAGEPLDIVYRTILERNSVRLMLSQSLLEGTRLTYGCGHSPVCNITDGRGFSLPAFGPLEISGLKKGLLPFITKWKVADVVAGGPPLAQVPPPRMEKLVTKIKSYGFDGFVNEHVVWDNKPGVAFFQAQIKLAEPMHLRFLIGYDGPFRLWLDGKPFFTNLAGTNPCLADESAKVAVLKRGIHDIRVGMDTRAGVSWGFFLRFERKDVDARKRAKGDYIKPEYLPA